MKLLEANLDGLVGPTHNYSGLAPGNEASQINAGNISNPKRAALQGLEKMRTLAQAGVPQMVMPPQPRPDSRFMHRLGFPGNVRQQVEAIAARAPELLPYIYSASGMWAANAATVTPAVDAADGKVHFTPANLVCTAHRAVEPAFASRALKLLFPGEHFVHHEALPANLILADEGAANHMRLALADGSGLHVFVYGRETPSLMQYTQRHPARQARQASLSIARAHGIAPARTAFLRQLPRAIDAGVFHNDVIATSHENVLLYHEDAFAAGDAPVDDLRRAAGGALSVIRVSAGELSLESAVASYLFNSQIVTTASGMMLIAPGECEHHNQARRVIDSICADSANPIASARFMDLRESMRNGGGPACLRLRVQLTPQQWQSVHQGAVMTDALHAQLVAWVERHYRDRLHPQDLADPRLAEEAQGALEALSYIIGLPDLYDF